MDVDHQGHFEDVGDLQDVQQANIDQGWQVPSPPHPAQNDGWDEWPQQEGELVGDNELNLVNNLANQVVVNAVENGLMQHPDMAQDSSSVSSEATTFFRAQGVPVTLELPLPPLGEVSRTANLPQLSGIEFESDFPIRQLANRVGLHSGFGPSPSVEMLIKELAQRASSLQAMLPLKAPLQAHEWNTFPQSWFVPGNWFFNVNNPNWGNNAEASSSTGIRLPRLQLLGPAHLVESLTQGEQALQADPMSTSGNGGEPPSVAPLGEGMDRPIDSAFADSGLTLPLEPSSPTCTPSQQHQKRKTKARTPIVEDEVRRSARLRTNDDAIHIQLENEPRKKRGDARKTVKYSKVEELKADIITGKLEQHEAEDREIEDINATLLVELGTGFYGVPPLELNTSTLQDSSED
jgi:anti-sigma28 factor (negative regulator of flagellin synthesis)